MYLRCDGEFWVTNNGTPRCDEWAVLTPEEIAADIDVTTLAELYSLLELAFSTPDTDAIQLAFMAGCTVPLIAYLASWGYQTVINFSQKEN